MNDQDRTTHRVEDSAAEREKDVVLALVARLALEAFDPEDPAHERFLEWSARDARLSLSGWERHQLALGAERFVRHVLARRDAERTRLGEIPQAPAVSPAYEQGTIAQVVPIAARLRHAPEVDLAVAAGAGRELWDEPCERWVALPDDVPDGRHLALRVAGDSMEPLLHAGDVILVKLGNDLVAGSVVVARVPDGGYVVKRVGGVAGVRVELTSLNPEYPPIVIPRDPSLILGTVLLRWCTHGLQHRASAERHPAH